MNQETVRQGARGGGVTVIGQIAKLVVQAAGVVVLSRLLLPEDFGLTAMVGVFLTLGNLFRDFGMPTAALQATHLTRQQSSNLFWVNSAFAFAATVVLACLAPVAVAIYDEPRLAAILPAMALSVLLNGVQSQVQVQLARSLRFTSLVVSDVLAQLVGLGVAIVAALIGWAYWALVLQVIVAAIALLVLRFALARWIPSLPRRGSGSRELIRAGGDIGAAQLLSYAANNADVLMIGIQATPAQVGFYNQAYQLLTVPVSRMLGPLTQVVVPSLTKASGSIQQRTNDLLLRIQPVLGFAVAWVFVSTACVADELIPLLLGAQWESSAATFKILAVGGVFQVFSYISFWGFLLSHQTKALFRYNLLTKTVTVVLIVIASFISIEAVAWAYSVSLAISWPINLWWLKRVAGQEPRPFLLNGIAIILMAAVSYLAGTGAQLIWAPSGGWIDAIAGMTAATLTFVLIVLLVPSGRRQAREVLGLMRSVRGG